MTKLLTPALCALLAAGGAAAIYLSGLRSIGPVASLVKTDAAVTLTCADGSEVRIAVLAPDLIRVRAAFLGKLPGRDHSWAIEKTSWDVPRWDLAEEPGALLISTGEVEVAVRRSPIFITFGGPQGHGALPNGRGSESACTTDRRQIAEPKPWTPPEPPATIVRP